MKTEVLSPKETVQEFFARTKGEADGTPYDLLSPNIELDYRVPSEYPNSGVHKGKEEALSALGAISKFVELVSFEIEQFIVEGDEVVMMARSCVRSKSTGEEAVIPVAEIYTVKDGLITRWRLHSDTYTGLKVMGLLPS